MTDPAGVEAPPFGPLDRALAWLDEHSRFGLPAVALLLGMALSLVFAPTNAFPVLFLVAPVLVRLIDRAPRPRRAFHLGWWVGFGQFSIGLNWIGQSFSRQDVVPPALAPVAVLALAALLALYVAGAFGLARLLWPGRRTLMAATGRLFVLAAAWTVMELARGTWFTGFPWHLLGSLWADWAWPVQGVYWLSVYGLSLVTLLAASAPVLVLDGHLGPRRLIPSAMLLALMVAVTLAGALRMAPTRVHTDITLRVVQANIDQKEKWVRHLIPEHFAEHVRRSRTGGEDGKIPPVDLLIWPEASIQTDSFDRQGSLERWRLSRLLPFGSFAIVGGPRFDSGPNGVDYYNSLFAVNSRADLFARYDKAHLVPFGEYMPFADFFRAIGLRQLARGAAGGGFSSGPGPESINLPGIPAFSPLICYEVIFPGAVIPAGERPHWLLNVTNDGWFGLSDGPRQHLAQARLRSVEEGLPMVRAAGTGISAVIDAYGRVVSHLALDRAGVMDSPLPRALAAPWLPTRVRILLVLGLAALILIYATYNIITYNKSTLK